MNNNLHDFLKSRENQSRATDAGRRMHEQMRRIFINGDETRGDTEILRAVKSRPDLVPFFDANSQCEVPIAGYIRGRFVSRRIDRLHINHDTKTIKILDYKSDTDKTAFYNNYVAQIREYQELMRAIYPGYTVRGFILWLHDFSLQEI